MLLGGSCGGMSVVVVGGRLGGLRVGGGHGSTFVSPSMRCCLYCSQRGI